MKRKFLAYLLMLTMLFNIAMPYGAYATDLQSDGFSQVLTDNETETGNDATDEVDGAATADTPSADAEQEAPTGDTPAVDEDYEAESDGKEADEPEQPAADEQPVEQPEQPAADEQPVEQPEQPAADEQPVEQPEQPAADEQPVEQPEQPAADEQPVEQPEQPAAPVLGGELTVGYLNTLQTAVDAYNSAANLILQVDGGNYWSNIGEVKVYNYNTATGEKGDEITVPAKVAGVYSISLAAGDYWVEGYHFNTKALLGGMHIAVTDTPATYNIKNLVNIKATNAAFSLSLKATSADGTVERKLEPVSDGRGAYTCIFVYGETVTATFTPTDETIMTSPVSASITPNSNNYEYAGPQAAFKIYHYLTVTAPLGSTIDAGIMVNYFKFDFAEPVGEAVNTETTTSLKFKLPEALGTNIWNGLLESHFIRVQHPDGITYWNGARWNADTTVEVSSSDLRIGDSSFNSKTVVNDFSNSILDLGNLYMSVNAQGFLPMSIGDTHEVNLHRNWQAVDSYWPSIVALPDMHFEVVDLDGNPSDVVTIEPTTKYNNSQVNVKANKNGTAIVLVTYDAVTLEKAYDITDEGETSNCLTFSAIWPEFTGVFVVNVGSNADINTNMILQRIDPNKADITATTQTTALDAEHDILFYTGNEGAGFSFKPEDGCTVSVARCNIAGGKMSFNGFTADNVTVADDGTVTVKGLKDGRHIVKVEKGGKAVYQVVTARSISYDLYKEDGETPITAENPAMPGDKVVVQFHRLVNPAERLAGAYNFTASVTLRDVDNTMFQSVKAVPGTTYGSYIFNGVESSQRLTVTIPRYIAEDSYDLLGSIYVGGFGNAPGAHRLPYMRYGAEREKGLSAGAGGDNCRIENISIPVKPAVMKERTLILQDESTSEKLTDISALSIKLTDLDGENIRLTGDKFTVPAGTYNYDISGAGVRRAQGSIAVTEDGLEYTVTVVKTAANAWGGSEETEPAQIDGVYQIGTGAELAWFSRQNINRVAVSGKLTADIDLANYAWNNNNPNAYVTTSVILDGDGHTISGLNATNGLFVMVGNGSKFTNLTVEGVVNCVGSGAAIVGNATGTTFENCVSKVNIVTSGPNVGGIVGFATNVIVKNCVNEGDITSVASTTPASYLGGLVGQAAGSSYVQIENGQNKGNITGNGQYAGGIIAYVNSTLDNRIIGCINNGDVAQGMACGGIVGQAKAKLVMQDCYNTGKSSEGGLAGNFGGYGSWGTADNNSPAIAKNCYSTGEAGSKALFGEFAGWASETNTFAENCVYLQGLKADPNGTELTAEQLKEFTPIASAIKPVCGGDRYPALSWEPGVKFHEVGTTGATIPAACTTDGYTEYTCKNCNKGYKDNFVSALGHSWCEDDGTGDCTDCNYTAPTCTAGGSLVRTCKNAGCEETNVTAVKALGHNWCTHDVNSTCEHCSYTTVAGCTNDGVLTRICTHDGCEEPKTAVVPALGHMINEAAKDDHPAYVISDCARSGCDVKNHKFWKSPYFEHMTLPDDYTKVKDLSMNTAEVGWKYNSENQRFENHGVFEKVSFNFTLLTSGTLEFGFGCRQTYGFYDNGIVTLAKGDTVLISDTINWQNMNDFAFKQYEKVLAKGTYTLSFEMTKGTYTDPDAYLYFKDVKLAAHDVEVNEADITAAQDVVAKIEAIDKTVTLDSERNIVSARNAYDALTDAQKQLVNNLSTLTAAEAALQALKDAAAAPKNITVYVSYYKEGEFVYGDDTAKTLLHKAPVTLEGTASDTFNMADAFKAFHTKYYAGGEAGYEGDSWVSKFWGESTSMVGYAKNNAWVLSAQEAVADNDTLTLYVLKDTTQYSDLLTWFDKDSYNATAGTAKSFTVNGVNLMGSGDKNPAVAKPAGATIKVYNAEGTELEALATTTDTNGMFKLTIPYNGTYTVVVSGTCSYTMSGGYYDGETRTDAPVVPTRCTVVASGGQDAPAKPVTPTFGTNLTGGVVMYVKGDTATALTVAATVTDEGTLSYKWQKSTNGTDWTDIADAATASYTPATDALGTVYYRCVAVNTLGGQTAMANSAAVQVEVYDETMKGRGTADDPYVIRTEADLLAINKNLAAHYILKADIAPATWQSAIASTGSTAFTGTLDGNGHTITLPQGATAGLIGNGNATTVVKNLRLVAPGVSSSQKMPALLFDYKSAGGINVYNCAVIGTLNVTNSSATYAGGIIARVSNNNVNVKNCYAAVTINPGESSAKCGALFGVVSYGKVSDVYYDSTLMANGVGDTGKAEPVGMATADLKLAAETLNKNKPEGMLSWQNAADDYPVFGEHAFVQSGSVSITGDLKAGATVTAVDNLTGTGTRSYSWYKVDGNGKETLIENATAKDYTLTAAEVGYKVKVVVAVANALGGNTDYTTDSAVASDKLVNVTFKVTPADANVLVVNSAGIIVSSGQTTVSLAAESSFKYYVGKNGYTPVAKTLTTGTADSTETVALAAKKLPGFSSEETYNMLIGNISKLPNFPTSVDEAVLKWCVPVGTNYSPGEPTNPVFVGDDLFMAGNVKAEDGNGYFIKKLDPATGKVLKKVQLETNVNYTYNYFLTTSEDMLFIMTKTGVEAYDTDLNRLWVSDKMPGSQGLCPINYSDGYVYGGTCMANTSVFFCLSAADGSLVWQNAPDVGSGRETGHYWAGGCIIGDYVVYGSDGGRIYAANKYTGKIASTVDVATGANVRSSVAYDNGKIYFTSTDGYVYVANFDQTNGQISDLKSALVGIKAEGGGFGGTTTATPAIYNNRLYVGSSSYFAVFNATTLENIYRTEQKHGTLRDLRLVADDANKCVYAFATYYTTPGGLVMYTDKADQTTPSAESDFGIFMTDTTKQYGASMPIFGPDGTIYASNDKGYLSAYIKPAAYLTGLTADVGKFSAEFDKKVMQHELVVPVGTKEVTLNITADDGAAVTVDGKELQGKTYKVALADEAANVTIGVAKNNCELTYKIAIRAIHTDNSISVATSTSNNIAIDTKAISAYDGKNNVYVITGGNDDIRIWLAPTDAKATMTEPQILSGTTRFYDVTSQNVYNGVAYPWRTYHSEPVYPIVITTTITAEDGTSAPYYVLAISDAAYDGKTAYKFGISLNKTELALKKNTDEALVANVAYLGDAPTVTWTSSEPTVAEVDATGKVTAKSEGTAVITAAIAEDMTATCTVTVTAAGSTGGGGTGGGTVEKTVPVYVTYSSEGQIAEGKDGTLLYKVPIEARDVDGDKKITMADAFVVLHEQYYEDGVDGIVVGETGWVSTFWGDSSSNFGYAKNHKWTDVAGSVSISKGDLLDIYLLADITEYSDLLTWFDQDSYTAKTGTAKTFTVKGANIFKSGPSSLATAYPENADVTVFDEDGNDVLTTKTDKNGQFKLTFADPGLYTVLVDGTCAYSAKGEFGAVDYSDATVVPTRCTVSVSGTSTGGSIGGGSDTDTKYTAADVKDLIDKIGTVTKDSKSAIEKAREAYDSLTAAQKKNVTNYDKLTAAEKAYTELTGEKIDTNKLPFTDVAKGAWYYDAIKAMYDKGLMNGESETKFMPNNKLSRAMLVTILYRMQNEPNVSTNALFNDVANGQWYTKAVAWASANNVVNGVGEGKFAPNDSVTRQEMAAMLYRYAKATGMDTTATASLNGFKDSAKVANWATDAMKWAVGSGLMKGNDDNTINPMGTATRAEVATVIIRLLSK